MSQKNVSRHDEGCMADAPVGAHHSDVPIILKKSINVNFSRVVSGYLLIVWRHGLFE